MVTVYGGIILISFLVNILLLQSAKHISGTEATLQRIFVAAGVGGLYSCACLIPGFHFLGNTLWRLVFLCLISVAAFGMAFSAMRPGVVYSMLNLALTGIISTMEHHSLPGILLGVAVIIGLCLLCSGSGLRGKRYVPVTLSYGETYLQLTALHDTGNTLRDPVTGKPVLIIDAKMACKLTGLTREQLRSPVESIGAIPGLRLIPYRTIGNCSGLLLALRFPKVRIGKWQGSSLVAFAPEGIGSESSYQALTGGTA